MRIGARIGYRGMVREIIAHLIEGLGSKSVALCATGGFAKWVLNGAQMSFSVEPNLTLEGLGRIFDLNCDGVLPKSKERLRREASAGSA